MALAMMAEFGIGGQEEREKAAYDEQLSHMQTNDAHGVLTYGVDANKSDVDTVIWDARPARKANKLNLETHGFPLEPHRSSLSEREFFQPDVVEKFYYEEMRAEIKALTKCDDVVILGHLARDNKAADKRGKDSPFAGGGNGVNGYVSVVHTDFRMEKAYDLANKLSKADADMRDANNRFMFINAWRNVSDRHPIYNNTLCCCDGKTVEYVMPDDVNLPGGKQAQQYRLSVAEAENHRTLAAPPRNAPAFRHAAPLSSRAWSSSVCVCVVFRLVLFPAGG